MSNHEIEQFVQLWEHESRVTQELLRTIPDDAYDFRPDPNVRSLGELAWHMAELESIMTSIAQARDFNVRAPSLDRPRSVPELASGYERVHRQAVERVRTIREDDLDRTFPFFGDRQISVRDVLRFPLLHHLIHHRGQLMMMIRLAHGVPSRVYGPNREDSVKAPS